MEKFQLSFNCRTAGERVLERSTLVNIRVDTVDEAVALYQELKASLGNGAVISEHKYLPQIPTACPLISRTGMSQHAYQRQGQQSSNLKFRADALSAVPG